MSSSSDSSSEDFEVLNPRNSNRETRNVNTNEESQHLDDDYYAPERIDSEDENTEPTITKLVSALYHYSFPTNTEINQIPKADALVNECITLANDLSLEFISELHVGYFNNVRLIYLSPKNQHTCRINSSFNIFIDYMRRKERLVAITEKIDRNTDDLKDKLIEFIDYIVQDVLRPRLNTRVRITKSDKEYTEIYKKAKEIVMILKKDFSNRQQKKLSFNYSDYPYYYLTFLVLTYGLSTLYRLMYINNFSNFYTDDYHFTDSYGDTDCLTNSRLNVGNEAANIVLRLYLDIITKAKYEVKQSFDESVMDLNQSNKKLIYRKEYDGWHASVNSMIPCLMIDDVPTSYYERYNSKVEELNGMQYILSKNRILKSVETYTFKGGVIQLVSLILIILIIVVIICIIIYQHNKRFDKQSINSYMY